MEMIESGGIAPANAGPAQASGAAAGLSGLSGKVSPSGMQRQFSINSLFSRSTAETKFTSEYGGKSKNSLVMSPSFRYGLHKKDMNPQQSISDIVNTKNPFLNKK
tara:strand:- start:136 stop:450 length:315 start_codon:yes stop_codon:yes gene_type:complete